MRTLLITLFLSFTSLTSVNHKYYLSVTDVVYNEEQKAVQIITRLFYDDLEDALNERYEQDLRVEATADQAVLDTYLKKYLDKKLTFEINGEPRTFTFIGKEYEDDQVVCYLEIENVTTVETIAINNLVFTDVFSDQKNMVHTDIYNKKKSFILVRENANALLNF